MQAKLKINKTGRPPGWLEYTGSRQGKNIIAWQMAYSADGVESVELEMEKITLQCKKEKSICWTDVRGLHNSVLLEKFGEEMGLSRLILEDMLNVNHPPKLDIGNGVVFISMKHIGEGAIDKDPVHVNVILRKGMVLSISDTEDFVFAAVKDRLEDPINKLKTFGPDHLFLRLVDLVVDHYIPNLDEMRERYDLLQERLIAGNQGSVLQDVMSLRGRLIKLRQAIFPLRTAVMELQNGMNELISESAEPYLRDVLEHLNQAAEDHRALSDAIPMLLELHHANISNHMNAVMKTLTIVASIFIPLTFLAGIYGMNFEYMPELSKPWAYPTLLAMMLVIALGMIYYMRTKKWL